MAEMPCKMILQVSDWKFLFRKGMKAPTLEISMKEVSTMKKKPKKPGKPY